MAETDAPGTPVGLLTSGADALRVLAAVDVPVVALRPGCEDVVAASAGAEAVSGLSSRRIVGAPPWETLVERSDSCALRQLLEPGAPTDLVVETRMRRGGPVHAWSRRDADLDAGGRWVLLTASPRVAATHGGGPASELEGPLILTDAHGEITRFSASAESLLGHPAADVLGRSVLRLFDPRQLAHRAEAAGLPAGLPLLMCDPSSFDRRRKRQVDLGDIDRRGGGQERHESGSCDWNLVRRDGAELVVALVVRPVLGTHGRPVGYELSGHDVTEERRTHSLLVRALLQEKEAAQRLADLDAARSAFVATASHELRTPLASIVGYAELLTDPGSGLPPSLRGFADAIVRNTERLQNLAADLLHLSPRGDEVRPQDRVDLAQVIASVAETIDPIAAEHGARLTVVAETSPALVLGRADRLGQVVLNLLSNAAKFTGGGGHISCRLTTEDGHAVVQVTDTGPGIDPAHLPHLFTPFFRTPEAKSVPGTGLGLSIVQQIVKEHAGQIEVDSRPDHGTTFTLRIPLLDPPVEQA